MKFPKVYYEITTENVAPLAGAWIEIFILAIHYTPLAEVAPLAGAWIEIKPVAVDRSGNVGRSPRGSVD